METSSMPAVIPIIKKTTSNPLIPGITQVSGTNGTNTQYKKTEAMVILRLPFRIINQPVKGIAISAPNEVANNTNPKVPLSTLNNSCTLGKRAARFACTKPFIKKRSLTAMRGGVMKYQAPKVTNNVGVLRCPASYFLPQPSDQRTTVNVVSP